MKMCPFLDTADRSPEQINQLLKVAGELAIQLMRRGLCRQHTRELLVSTLALIAHIGDEEDRLYFLGPEAIELFSLMMVALQDAWPKKNERPPIHG